jgi:hypothetical protein
MDEQIEELAEEPRPEPKTNRGWFQLADPRINREGRPVGRKAAPADPEADCARRADRLMRLFVPERRVACRLTHPIAPWIRNLPRDYRIVDCRLDPARGGIVFIVWSQKFRRIARGAEIPEWTPDYSSLEWSYLEGQ